MIWDIRLYFWTIFLKYLLQWRPSFFIKPIIVTLITSTIFYLPWLSTTIIEFTFCSSSWSHKLSFSLSCSPYVSGPIIIFLSNHDKCVISLFGLWILVSERIKLLAHRFKSKFFNLIFIIFLKINKNYN